MSSPTLAGELIFTGPKTSLNAEVAEAEAVFMHGMPSVQFSLSPASGDAMADMTGDMLGEELIVSLCGRNLVRAVVRERIAGKGIINLPTIEAAIAVADFLNGNEDCAGLEKHFAE